MIYIPIEVQLQWIREDLEQIKLRLEPIRYYVSAEDCPECKFVKDFGLGESRCKNHAPEWNMRITFPME